MEANQSFNIFSGAANFHLEEFVSTSMKLATIIFKMDIKIDMFFMKFSTLVKQRNPTLES